jgi:hypothetical protein
MIGSRTFSTLSSLSHGNLGFHWVRHAQIEKVINRLVPHRLKLESFLHMIERISLLTRLCQTPCVPF